MYYTAFMQKRGNEILMIEDSGFRVQGSKGSGGGFVAF